MMKKTERSVCDVDRLVCAAVKAANSNTVDGFARCVDILQHLKRFSLSVSDLPRATLPLESLRKHRNPKIRNGVDVLLKSWTMKTLNGRKPPTKKQVSERVKKPNVVTTTTRPLQAKKVPVLKNNLTETLELFEIAKKSADVANAKGFLAAKEESSICVDTLALLIGYPISSTATDTRRIMERLERLTNHKDRKICNSSLALLRHWEQSIRDQQGQKQ